MFLICIASSFVTARIMKTLHRRQFRGRTFYFLTFTTLFPLCLDYVPSRESNVAVQKIEVEFSIHIRFEVPRTQKSGLEKMAVQATLLLSCGETRTHWL